MCHCQESYMVCSIVSPGMHIHCFRRQEAASCAVCLAEYEAGEMLRQLPPCGHEFHLACIDPWLSNHTTCPMCRCSLLPPPVAQVPMLHPLRSNAQASTLQQVKKLEAA